MTDSAPHYMTTKFPYGTRLVVRNWAGDPVFVGTLILQWYGVTEYLDIQADYSRQVEGFAPELGYTFWEIGLEEDPMRDELPLVEGLKALKGDVIR